LGKNVPQPINGVEDIFITMDVVVSEKQIINFLRRRFYGLLMMFRK